MKYFLYLIIENGCNILGTMKVKTIQGISVEEIKKELAVVCGNNYHPTIAIVFSSVKHDLNELGMLFDRYDITVFGSSSSGEIEQDEIFEQ